MSKKYLFLFLALVLIGCQKESQEWNPLFEYTGFGYLENDIQKSISLVEDTSLQASKGDLDAVRKNLDQIKQKLVEIQDYYIPLTTIRQKIYDAERFYKIRKIKQAKELLKGSVNLLNSMDTRVKNKVFDKLILELETMINKVTLSIDNESESNTYKDMKRLGEHINLMLLKGDLVLSEVDFSKAD